RKAHSKPRPPAEAGGGLNIRASAVSPSHSPSHPIPHGPEVGAAYQIGEDQVRARYTAGFRRSLCRLWVIHVIPAIAACPVRPKSGDLANARVYGVRRVARAPLF